MIRIPLLKNSVAFVGLLVFVCCLSVITISTLRLPQVPLERWVPKSPEDEFSICEFGQIMIQMLPEDLPFTVFVPSKTAFERDLKLQANDSLSEEKKSDVYAIVSRILGFSAVPRSINSGDIHFGEDIVYDSISGFALYISKDEDQTLVVNRVRSERVNVKRKKIIVHVMDGVIMDAKFEESFQPDIDDGDEK